jgi:O-acetylserine/cysteine efflux transporter
VRFGLLAIPTILFVPRPKIRVRWLLAVGACLGILQFGFLYLGMSAGIQSGLASIVLQASAPFTVLIAAVLLRERISGRQAIGIGIAVAGLAAIAVHRAQVSAILPVVLVLAAAFGWALGNVASRKAAAPNALHLTLWMSVVPPIPLFVLSWVFEGPHAIGASLSTAFTLGALPSLLGLLYVVVMATVVGYGLWNRLLSIYPSSTVAPFSMLVPIIGVLASWLAFGQAPDAIELGSGVLVVGGVVFASWRRRRVVAALLPEVDGDPTGLPRDVVPVR